MWVEVTEGHYKGRFGSVNEIAKGPRGVYRIMFYGMGKAPLISILVEHSRIMSKAEVIKRTIGHDAL